MPGLSFRFEWRFELSEAVMSEKYTCTDVCIYTQTQTDSIMSAPLPSACYASIPLQYRLSQFKCVLCVIVG